MRPSRRPRAAAILVELRPWLACGSSAGATARAPRRLAGQAPAVRRSRAGPSRRRRSAGPRSTRARVQRRPSGGASSGSGAGLEVQVAAEVHEQQPVVAVRRRRSAATNASGPSTAPSSPSRALRGGAPGPRGAARSRSRCRRTGLGVASRAPRGRACSARTSRGSRGIGRGRRPTRAGEAAELREELAAPRRAPASPARALVVGEVEERRRRPRTPAPGRASACPGPSSRSAVIARQRAGAGQLRAARRPRAELATWSWFWRKVTNAGGGRPNAGVPAPLAPARRTAAPGRGSRTCSGRDELLRRAAVVGVVGLVAAGEGDHARCGGSRRSRARRGRSRPRSAGRTSRVCCGSFSATMMMRAAARGRRAPRGRRAARMCSGDVVEDALRRVEAQAVEVELVDPVARRWRRRTRAPAPLPSPSKLIASPHSVP